MMKRFFCLFRTDWINAMRNHFLLVIFIILVVMTGVYHLLPRELDSSGGAEFFCDATSRGILKETLETQFPASRILASPREVQDRVRENRGIMGFVFRDNREMDFYYNGTLPEEQINMIRVMAEGWYSAALGEESVPDFSILVLGKEEAPLDLKQTLMPVLITFEVLVLGFLFVAVMVFQEKQERTVLFYRLTPGGVWSYILAKVMVWVLILDLYGFFFILFTLGPGVPWYQVMPLITLGGMVMTFLGFTVSMFFRNISEWFFAGVGILVINMLPQLGFVQPLFSPSWLRWLPAYDMLFALKYLFFSSGDPGIIGHAFGLQGLWLLALIIPAYFSCRRKLMKEG